MLKPHDVAPEFTLPDQDGTLHRLSDSHGQWVLLYFYPKDDTPGCTTEACAIRDQFPQFNNARLKVFGVSTDAVESHKKFAAKYGLPFPLLSDKEKDVVKRYGVQSLIGTKRSSFLIDPEGRIAKIYTNVKPPQHASEVLTDLEIRTK
jgi:peroxiredoxin Q/BCP